MIIPPGEKIVERKICAISGEEFFVTDKDLEFYDKVSPLFNGKKYSIPSPTLCPEERMRRRLCFRNERILYKRKCDFSHEEIVTLYSPKNPYKVYKNTHWYSDGWSAAEYGKAFDFNQAFFPQFQAMRKDVPRIALAAINNENCDYANQLWNCKNVYMSFDVGFSLEVYFSNKAYYCEHCFDSLSIHEGKYSLGLVDCFACERCFHCCDSKNCHDSAFCYDCEGCSDVFFCSHLRNKQKRIFNKPATDEEIRKLRTQFHDAKKWAESIDIWRKTVIQKTFHRSANILNCENCIGNYLSNSQNCFTCFDINKSKNCKFCHSADEDGFDLMDISHIAFTNNSYDSLIVAGGNILFTHGSYDPNNRDLLYCDLCTAGNINCFGCVGLHNHEHHCILNKSYSTQEYEVLCGKIIDHMRTTGEWGEFFPHELSSYAYNETVAQEYFPVIPGQDGWHEFAGNMVKGNLRIIWRKEEEKKFDGSTIQPLSIEQYDEKIVGFETAQKNIDVLLNGIIVCEVTKKPFKIIRQELAFYIENGIPIPTKHPDQRHTERMNLRNPRKPFERTCSECKKEIITTYAPERPERVVCEECYRRLVY